MDAIVECVTDETGPEWHVSFIFDRIKFRSQVTQSEKKAEHCASELNKLVEINHDTQSIDYIGQALNLEACAKRVESQTVERSMLAAAVTLRKLHKALTPNVM